MTDKPLIQGSNEGVWDPKLGGLVLSYPSNGKMIGVLRWGAEVHGDRQ